MLLGRDVFLFVFLFWLLTHLVLGVSFGVVGDRVLGGARSSYLYCSTAFIISICVHDTGLHVRTKLLNTLYNAQVILAPQLNHDNFTVS